jgi:hypothetical protein
VDVSEPASPTIVFTFPDEYDYSLKHVVVYGEYHVTTDHVYAAAGILLVFGWIDRNQENCTFRMRIIYDRELHCPIGDLEIAGDKLYVTSLYNTSLPTNTERPGIIVFDAANPTNEEPISTYNGSAWGLAVLDKSVIVADQESGIYSLKWWSPRKFFLPLVQ